MRQDQVFAGRVDQRVNLTLHRYQSLVVMYRLILRVAYTTVQTLQPLSATMTFPLIEAGSHIQAGSLIQAGVWVHLFEYKPGL